MPNRKVLHVVARYALLAAFVAVVALSIGCDSNQDDCVNDTWQCDSSHKEIDHCVDHKWKFVELCVAPNNFCREGQGFDCHGPSTACCDVLPQALTSDPLEK